MEKHKKTIEKYDGSLEELAEDIGNLRYDALEHFLITLSNKLAKDSFADKERSRPRLANALASASSQILHSTNSISEAWDISKPYMNE